MTAALAEACGELAAWLPAAHALITQPDTDGTTPGGKPGSKPPWNTQAANALLDAHQGARRLEQVLRLEVTTTFTVRGGSDANTLAAIRAIADLGVNASHATAADATRQIMGMVTAILQLRAVDRDERFILVHGAACWHCQTPMLRLAERSGRVTCLRYGACFDCAGHHPVGFVTQSLDGAPVVDWQDGCVQYGTMESGQ